MNITEANALNTVLDHVMGMRHPGRAPVCSEDAEAAAAMLMDRAHKVLSAGLTAQDVHAHWSGAQPSGPVLPSTASLDVDMHLVRLLADRMESRLAQDVPLPADPAPLLTNLGNALVDLVIVVDAIHKYQPESVGSVPAQDSLRDALCTLNDAANDFDVLTERMQ